MLFMRMLLKCTSLTLWHSRPIAETEAELEDVDRGRRSAAEKGISELQQRVQQIAITTRAQRDSTPMARNRSPIQRDAGPTARFQRHSGPTARFHRDSGPSRSQRDSSLPNTPPGGSGREYKGRWKRSSSVESK
ncbi:hypothetical protein T492DRAFT_1145537 [Pavlovales sp. CCMP2436]|nr:hypothetical protein T492DRAFT_1145537 [Pavlovales sp. CCMP2436]